MITASDSVCHREENVTATEMLKLMNRSPFKPFDIYMNDGLKLTIDEPFKIATSRNSPCCTVYDDHDEMHIVSYRNITRVVTAAEPSQSA